MSGTLTMLFPHGSTSTCMQVFLNYARIFKKNISLLFFQWVETDFSTQWCFENFIQHRSMRRARDVRDQLVGLMERVEIKLTTNPLDTVAIRKVCNCLMGGGRLTTPLQS